MESINLLVFLLPTANSIEINYYWDAAVQAVGGKLPYVDFDWIYSPALLLVFMGLKGIFRDTEAFVGAWSGLLMGCGVMLGLGLYRVAKEKLGMKLPYLQLGSAGLGIFLLLTVGKALINPDLLVAVLVFAALRLRSKDESKNWAMVLLGTGAALRLYPAVLLPLFVDVYKFKKSVLRIGLFAIPILGMFVPFGSWEVVRSYISDGLLFHVTRPIEVGSISASLMQVAKMEGAKIVSEADYITNVLYVKFAGEAPGWWKYLVMIKEVPLMMAGYLVWKKMWDQKSAGEIYGLSLLLIMVMIIRSPVFSSQYLMWIWGPVFLWLIETKASGQMTSKITRGFIGLLILIHIFNATYLSYYLPGRVEELVELKAMPMAIIGVKNILFVMMFGWVWWQIKKLKAPG